MKTVKILTIAIAALFLFACKDDDDTSVTPDLPITPNEEELITTVRLKFLDTSGATTIFEFNDLDGDGGNAPTIDTVKLKKGEAYQLSIEFLDASDPSNIEDITEEIKEEDDEHFICFATTSISGVSIQRTDTDGTYEVGLESTVMVDSSATSTNGVIQVTLKHQPGVKDGTCAPGETDVEVDFPIQLN